MTSVAPATVESPAVVAPYIGLRPFESTERDRFFGRERDAQILCDRVLSSRLTILYALSGLGKSSLLRALVIPKLEDNHARVLYFDAWSQQDPLRALKQALTKLALSLGVPETNPEALSLTELVRLLSSVDDRNVVLVFDQFEEFLVRHAQKLDPLRTELAALVRASKVDVAVVLTLREEFLAALEPFRQQILNLFQSAYRLEALSEGDLSKAIREPARMFGGECTEELSNALIHDLEGGEADLAAGPQLSLGLPMLQLVCQELWKQSAGGQLTLALYERLGRVQRIINDYVRRLMPQARQQQSVTAALLTHLAPPSNMKMSYSVDDLADITGLPRGSIEGELKRLETARILRTREYHAGLRYELEHDAFIPVLRNWRREVLERSRRWEWVWRIARVAAAVFVVLTLIGYALRLKEREADEKRTQQQQLSIDRLHLKGAEDAAQIANLRKSEAEKKKQLLEDWQGGGLLRELNDLDEAKKKALAASRFDVLTAYFLLKRSDPERLQDLRTVLREYQQLIPADYAEPVTEDDASSSGAPLEIVFPSAVAKVDAAHFLIPWRQFGKQITQLYGIPVPMFVRLSNGDVAAGRLKISAGSANLMEIAVPQPADEYLVRYSLNDLGNSPAKEFLKKFHSDWKQFERPEWTLVPKWSLPVWKLAKQMASAKVAGFEVATSPSGIAAYEALLQLERPENAKVFFSESVVRFLLQNVPPEYHTSLSEAEAARGNCLVSDLSARLQAAATVHALPRILDELANQPCRATESNSRPGRARNQTAQVPQSAADQSGDTRLFGPWPQQRHDFAALSGADYMAFGGLKDSLPTYSPVQVGVGSELESVWTSGNEPASAVKPLLEIARDKLYRSYGVEMPAPVFRSYLLHGAPSPHAVRIEMGGDPQADADVLRILSGERAVKGTGGEELAAALSDVYISTRSLWISPEVIQDAVNRLPAKTQDWVSTRYSITDLKKILRMLVAAQGDGASARYAPWLIDSLCFWTLADNETLNAEAIRDRLLQLQRVRLGISHPLVRPEVGPIVERGIDALINDNLAVAEKEFRSALSQNKQAAADAFAVVWSSRLPEIWLRDYREDFTDLRSLELIRSERLDLQDVIANQVEIASGPTQELTVYRMAANLIEPPAQMKLVHDLLRHQGSPADWDPEEALWVALRFLRQYDPAKVETGDQGEFENATALLKSAVQRLPNQERADSAFNDVVTVSRTQVQPEGADQHRDTPNWAWRLLDDLVKTRPGGPLSNLQLELAWILADEERPDRLREALRLLANYQTILTSSVLTAEQRDFQQEQINYTRARADRSLQMLGDEKLGEEARQIFEKLLRSKQEDTAQYAHTELFRMQFDCAPDAASRDKAAALATEVERRWHDQAEFLSRFRYTQLLICVKAGDRACVTQLAPFRAGSAAEKPAAGGGEDEYLLLGRAIGLTITQSGDWKRAAAHYIEKHLGFENYVLMLYYAFSPEPNSDARRLLDKRWSRVRPESWDYRLTNGDTGAWQEMLIGRMENEPRTRDLLEIVEDEAKWKASPLSQLPTSRNGQRCEAWFYEAMRARALGQTDYMRECLKKCLAANYWTYNEHAMAAFLLKPAVN